jgi:glycosyltransferase involved in cell wall biosynthesis
MGERAIRAGMLQQEKSPSLKGEATAARTTKLRVLLVAPSLDILGGQAVQASRLLARLSREDDIEVSFLPHNPRLPGPLRKLQSIKYVRTVFPALFYVALLLARIPKYDVIHIFSASYLSFLLAPTPAILIAKLYGKKVVLNYRSGEAADHLKHWARTALPIVRMADEIAVPSGYLVDVFEQFNLKARAVFNFVDTDRFRFRKRVPLRPNFLSNRNLEPMYNVACILRAFAMIQQRFPEARLTVAGDGSQRAELERLARELNLRGVEFAGRVAPQKMPELYDAADIYLNSSNIDNMPGSIIEAFASGLPVVTTNAGGIPYIVTDSETGLLARLDDHKAIAERAIRLLEDKGLASKIITLAHEECRKYNWDAVKRDWLDLYHEAGHDMASAKSKANGESRKVA